MANSRHTVPAYGWALFGVTILANILGFMFDLWSQYPLYDDFMHFVTPFALTLVLAYYLSSSVLSGPSVSPALWIFVLAGVGLGIGAVWEIFEWVVRQFTDAQEKKVVDTIIDLSLDLVGSILAAVFVKSRFKAGSPRAQEHGLP